MSMWRACLVVVVVWFIVLPCVLCAPLRGRNVATGSGDDRLDAKANETSAVVGTEGDPVTVLDTEIVAANRTHSEIGGDRGGAILAAVEAETNSTRLQVAGDRAAVNSEGGKTEANWTRSELMKGGDGEKAAMVAVEQTALLDRKAGGKARETAEDDVVPATNKLPDAADKLGHEGDRRWKHMEKTVFIDVKVLNKGEKRVPPIHLGTEKSEHEEGIGSRYVEQLINLHVSSEDESEDEELERALGKLSPPDVEALEAFPPAPSSDLPGADEDNSENEEEVDDYDDPYAMLLNRAEPATEQAESVAQLERINKIYRAVIAMDGYNPPNVQRVFQGHDPKQIVISGDGFRESTACYFSGSAPARMVKVAAKFISHKRILCVVPDDVLLPGTRFTVMVGSDVTGFAAPMYMQTAADNVKHDGSINLALSPRFIFAGLLTILIISYVATNKDERKRTRSASFHSSRALIGNVPDSVSALTSRLLRQRGKPILTFREKSLRALNEPVSPKVADNISSSNGVERVPPNMANIPAVALCKPPKKNKRVRSIMLGAEEPPGRGGVAVAAKETMSIITKEPSANSKQEPSTNANVEDTSTAANVEPLAAANLEPSAAANMKPSAAANMKPSAAANVEPSAAANVEPSAAANVEPSAAANVEPSAAANVEPSAAASVEPSAAASVEPSAAASVEPSATANVEEPLGNTHVETLSTASVRRPLGVDGINLPESELSQAPSGEHTQRLIGRARRKGMKKLNEDEKGSI